MYKTEKRNLKVSLRYRKQRFQQNMTESNITQAPFSNITANTTSTTRSSMSEDISIMKIVHSIIGSVGIVANLTVVLVFLNHKKFRQKIPNIFIIHQVGKFLILYNLHNTMKILCSSMPGCVSGRTSLGMLPLTVSAASLWKVLHISWCNNGKLLWFCFGSFRSSLKVLRVKCVPGETLLLCALFYLKCSCFSLLLAEALLPYRTRCTYLVRQSCMFCLMCGSSLVGTAFFILCGPIFVFTCGGLNRMWFLRYWGYTY